MNRPLRLNPRYTLIETSHSAMGGTPVWSRLAEDPAVSAVLQPGPGIALSAKAVDRETARFLRSLGDGTAMGAATASPDAVPPVEAIAGMILDGVLEVFLDGEYVNGTALHPRLFPSRDGGEDSGRIGALSHEALTYAQALPIDDPVELAARLYTYNTIPMGPRWASRFGNDAIVLDALQLGVDGFARGHYVTVGNPHWHVWHRPSASGAGLPFKVYVSPHPRDLEDVVPDAVRMFIGLDVDSFKLGKGAAGLLRPDKLVAYIRDREQLDRVTSALAHALRPWRAQGVPFTAASDASGMVTWAADPPDEERVPGWERRESWRTWVTNHLAVSVIQAKREAREDVEPWRFAVDRLSLEGVDVVRWTPPLDLWVGS